MSGLAFGAKRFVLHTLVEKAASALAERDLMPVLKNFQVVVGPEQIQIAATDRELAVVASTRAVDIRSVGAAVFPGRRFLDLVREAEEGDMVVEVTEDDGLAAHVGAGRASWVLRLMAADTYPSIPHLNGNRTGLYFLDKERFVDALARVRYAAATDQIKASLMLVSVAKGQMRAADGNRFHQIDLSSWWPTGLDLEIPIGAVDPLIHLLRSSSESRVEVGDSPDHVVFQIGADTYIVSKSAVSFPQIEELIGRPSLENDQELRVGRADLIGAIKRMRIAADVETQAVRLGLRPTVIEVSCSDGMGNMAREEIPATWDGDDREIAFNQSYLTDMLQSSEDSVIRLLLGTDHRRRRSPVLMRSEQQMAVLNQVRVA